MKTTSTTSIKIHWTFVVFLAVICFLFYYGCTNSAAPQKTDNQYFLKKIDSLHNVIIDFENQIDEERTERKKLYMQRDSLENIIDRDYIYIPTIQQLKRTK